MIRSPRLARLFVCTGLIAAALAGRAFAAQAPKPTPAEQAEIDKFKAILASEHPKQGDVTAPGADASLHLGKDDSYFLDAADAKRVFVEAWGNPPAPKPELGPDPSHSFGAHDPEATPTTLSDTGTGS